MNQKKILIVDDEEEIILAVQARLEANGYDVIAAHDGEEGLKMARENKVDLVILDLMLPKMDGYKVCALLKKDERYAKIPVLMFTARAGAEEARIAVEDCKANAYLTKPFDAPVLLKKIAELIQS
ncbi:MAG: two-component system response regulator [Candidatus Omnitrophica bacterium CG11_big_fil_rev_8_21_14_0_20_45_26]|uniref:Two-component system response regulator n=1 Tax=Candidatus Abzuiibacterium crystallinum TaxID=1974748 RepID=A0A2H0LNU9_9BACT|nr:MAG: two-component system response regulator [Candidatus Omnitrophica bacterium CG11_big_fil_rev_8_21_14_0_20_45_26]PIW63226.1 MAG: two-component system response regulator [Candidatus Omnitrophica bacterium CG12_big_fil_rev_8_21_14_0_65_45_16]